MTLLRWESDSPCFCCSAPLYLTWFILLCAKAAPLTGESFFLDTLNHCEILPGGDCCHVKCVFGVEEWDLPLCQKQVLLKYDVPLQEDACRLEICEQDAWVGASVETGSCVVDMHTSRLFRESNGNCAYVLTKHLVSSAWEAVFSLLFPDLLFLTSNSKPFISNT